MPRGIGRALVEAGVREMLREEEEQERQKAALRNKTNEQEAALLSNESNGKREAPVSSPVVKKKKKTADPAPYAAAGPAYMQFMPAQAFSAVAPYMPPSNLDMLSDPAVSAIVQFQSLITWLRQNATDEWKIVNRMTNNDAPKDLYDFCSNSILVFSFAMSKTNNNLLVGGTMYRKPSFKAKLYSHLCDSLMEIDRTTGHVLRRETNWQDMQRREGMIVYMFRHMMTGNMRDIRVFEDPDGFLIEQEEQEAGKKVGSHLQYALCLFQNQLEWLK